jgi:hypothetical protein
MQIEVQACMQIEVREKGGSARVIERGVAAIGAALGRPH